ncbi:hypothetical protein BKA70DRAFT_1238513 [Coprinopsis sp. MPI-PUGE-AT-0042]|nr:hypothetical protein BKA70DRAFT_1238513 [Coprinopsis sp. MPI-PUGE-AT-0042]
MPMVALGPFLKSVVSATGLARLPTFNKHRNNQRMVAAPKSYLDCMRLVPVNSKDLRLVHLLFDTSAQFEYSSGSKYSKRGHYFVKSRSVRSMLSHCHASAGTMVPYCLSSMLLSVTNRLRTDEGTGSLEDRPLEFVNTPDLAVVINIGPAFAFGQNIPNHNYDAGGQNYSGIKPCS